MSEPVLVAVIFADRIITEDNGKKGLIGVFSQFMSPKFPVVFPPWSIYIGLTNLQGKHSFSLKIIHETGDEVIPVAGEMDVKNLNDVVELVFNIENAVFNKPGRHILTLYLDGNIAGSRILPVNEIPGTEN